MKDTKTPELLINYRCFDADADKLLGTVDVELPKIEAMTETLSGAGIAGEVETAIVGHIKAMSAKINFRTVTHSTFNLGVPTGVSLTFRGSIQTTESGTFLPLVVRVKGVAKSTDLGKLEAGKTMGSAVELSLNYLKITLDGDEKVEIDQHNYIYSIDGENYLADVKTQLGEV